MDLDLPSTSWPMTLAELHRALAPGARVETMVPFIPGSAWCTERLADLFAGAGFDGISITEAGGAYEVTATRCRSLADTVAPGMSLLVCGLNPSLYAADAGVGYARPSNRFWPAAVAAGLVSQPRDARAALRDHGVGMTDLVKRATARSSEVSRDEYVLGTARVRRLVEWMQPRTVCFVGMEGYRVAVDRRGRPGWQAARFGGRPTYVMPSTSGLNAARRPADFVAHLRAAIAGPPDA